MSFQLAKRWSYWFAAAVVAINISGCVSVAMNGPEMNSTVISKPEIGVAVTAFVGDDLVQKGLLIEAKALKVKEVASIFGYTIAKGTFSQLGHNAEFQFFDASRVVSNGLVSPPQSIMVARASTNELCVTNINSVYACGAAVFERATELHQGDKGFQQTLIYSGRFGDKIRVGYREFSNNLARPAFYNDVEYDLSQSNVIGYKGAKLEILKADNVSITYKVQSNFPERDLSN